MKSKTAKSKDLIGMTDTSLLSKVASKLKGKVLFPEKIDEAKKYLQKAKFQK